MNPKLVLARRAVLPLAALGLIAFAFTVANRPEVDAAAATPAGAPASAAPGAGAVVAALGLVEPSSETIAVAAELPGIVREVYVTAGQDVAAGAPLFRLDTRAVEAQLAAARAALRVAEVEARDARARAELYTTITDARAVSADEKDRVRFAAERAQATVALRAAEVKQLETDLARLTVRSPLAGRVLRVNVRAGEFAPAGPSSEPLIALGDVTPLHVRVQIDEEDASRIEAGAAAEGALRGDNARRVALRFVRFEPQATPKRNLTGGAERIDTRVVEAIYAFEPTELRAFVGQQMDVFVEARPVTARVASAAGAP
ncbi:MAG: efflux RND transporter periplasmic adaptor subunit [Steroidobacteraceae bacterium]|jgi:multidrug efflux pump subunit AcrA (membrane-fusion protein)|nr:efflux RND transporter periplasmic adaptor subunit [Steroidobacteraceae bacterium]